MSFKDWTKEWVIFFRFDIQGCWYSNFFCSQVGRVGFMAVNFKLHFRTFPNRVNIWWRASIKTLGIFAGEALGVGTSPTVGQVAKAWVNAMMWLVSWQVSSYSSIWVTEILKSVWLFAPLVLSSSSWGCAWCWFALVFKCIPTMV